MAYSKIKTFLANIASMDFIAKAMIIKLKFSQSGISLLFRSDIEAKVSQIKAIGIRI